MATTTTATTTKIGANNQAANTNKPTKNTAKKIGGVASLTPAQRKSWGLDPLPSKDPPPNKKHRPNRLELLLAKPSMLEERKPTTHDLKWSEKLEELKAYKKERGHTQVPVDYRENPSLGKWAASQRSSYVMLQKNNPRARITEDRINILNEIGFEWALQDSHWQQYFAELQRYKALYGDCYVTSRYGSGNLGGWVKRQRSQYRNMVQNKSHSLTMEKIQKLESLDFDFNVGKKTLRKPNSAEHYGRTCTSRSATNFTPVVAAQTLSAETQGLQPHVHDLTAGNTTILDYANDDNSSSNSVSDHAAASLQMQTASVIGTTANNLNVATNFSAVDVVQGNGSSNFQMGEYDKLLYCSYRKQEQLEFELNKVRRERDMWKQKFEDLLTSSSGLDMSKTADV